MKHPTLLAALLLSAAAGAQVTLSPTEKATPGDEIFMDMAVTAATRATAAGLKPAGAVIIMNGAWKATGMPSATLTPEEDAINKTRRTSLDGACVYTVNRPTTAALNAMARAGVSQVVYVNPADSVVAAGVYPAEAYDPDGADTTLTPVPMFMMNYPPAAEILHR